jgi:hypothetical protein
VVLLLNVLVVVVDVVVITVVAKLVAGVEIIVVDKFVVVEVLGTSSNTQTVTINAIKQSNARIPKVTVNANGHLLSLVMAVSGSLKTNAHHMLAKPHKMSSSLLT